MKTIVKSPFAHKVNGKWYVSSHAQPQCHSIEGYKAQVREAYGNLRGVTFAQQGVDYENFVSEGDSLYPTLPADLDYSVWAASEYAIGHPFHFVAGQKVICNGYPGVVQGMYCPGMVEVRLEAGPVCVSSSYPDCFPDPLDFHWVEDQDHQRVTLFNRMGRQFHTLRKQGSKWHIYDLGERFSRREDAMSAAKKHARWMIQNEIAERVSRSTAFNH